MDPGSSPFEETQNQISLMFALTGRSWTKSPPHLCWQPPQCTDWQILTTPALHWLADLDNPPLTTPTVHWLADLDKCTPHPRSALTNSKQHKWCRKCLHARSINTPHHLCRSREYYNACPQPQCPAPTIAFLQKHGGATALDDTMGHDGDAVTQQVCLVHEVGGEQQRAASAVSLKDVPRLTPSSWVHPWRWLIQNNNLPGKKTKKEKSQIRQPPSAPPPKKKRRKKEEVTCTIT